MFLSDGEIQALCDNPQTEWSPSSGPLMGQLLPIENAGPLVEPLLLKNLGSASVDLRVAPKFASPQALQAYVVRGTDRVRPVGGGVEVDGERELRHDDERIEIVLEPHQVILCHSMEYIRMLPSLVGLLAMRSSFAREWLNHSAADFVQPGFQGTITYELKNDGPRPYSIYSGDSVMQIAFARMSMVPARPYKGMYQNQQGQLNSLRDPKTAK